MGGTLYSGERALLAPAPSKVADVTGAHGNLQALVFQEPPDQRQIVVGHGREQVVLKMIVAAQRPDEEPFEDVGIRAARHPAAVRGDVIADLERVFAGGTQMDLRRIERGKGQSIEIDIELEADHS